jgi:hypothetical protein
MSKLRILTAAAIMLASMGAPPLSAQNAGGNGPGRPPFLLRYPPYTAWHFDGRDDVRDFPKNGFFPGDFAANPAGAWVGAAGIFGWTPRSPRLAYESQPDRSACAQQYRSYNAASAWHHCR